MEDSWLKEFKMCSNVLMQYGWFVAPYINGISFERVKKLCFEIENNQKSRNSDEIDDMIFYSLADSVFHPNYRAKYVCHSMKISHFNQFSHIYESAIFSFFKREYAATVVLLLSALEGILRSFANIGINDNKKPILKTIIGLVKNSSALENNTTDDIHDLYRDTLVKYLEDRIYAQTNMMDASVSFLNRHYIFHGVEAGNYYSPKEVHRIILVFDLLIEWMSCNQSIFDSCFVNDEDSKVASRIEYYHQLAEGQPTLKQTWVTERHLLREHMNYVSPSVEYDNDKSRISNLKDYIAIFKDLPIKPQI